MKEGLGYSLKNYDPCFNFNNDNFCCSQGNAQLYTNLMLRRARGQASMNNNLQSSYSAQRNQNPVNFSTLEMQRTGMVQPSPYNFPPLTGWYVPCSRMPCGIYGNKLPCGRK